jgi:hypothetical protein
LLPLRTGNKPVNSCRGTQALRAFRTDRFIAFYPARMAGWRACVGSRGPPRDVRDGIHRGWCALAIRSTVTDDQSSNQLKKLVERDRLAQVPVVQEGGAVRRRHLTGQEDYRHPRIRIGVSEHWAKSQSVNARHMPIGHDGVGCPAVCLRERLPPVERGGNVVGWTQAGAALPRCPRARCPLVVRGSCVLISRPVSALCACAVPRAHTYRRAPE